MQLSKREMKSIDKLSEKTVKEYLLFAKIHWVFGGLLFIWSAILLIGNESMWKTIIIFAVLCSALGFGWFNYYKDGRKILYLKQQLEQK